LEDALNTVRITGGGTGLGAGKNNLNKIIKKFENAKNLCFNCFRKTSVKQKLWFRSQMIEIGFLHVPSGALRQKYCDTI